MSNIKAEILKHLSINLEVFRPDLKNHFLCPVCLTAIPLTEKSKISEAHIIPKAAKGKLKTYLCTKCNSFLGTNQDKWFGEFIKVMRKESSFITTNAKEGNFFVDDIRVNGKYKENDDGRISFYYRTDKNSPKTVRLLNDKFKRRPSEIQIRMSYPLMMNKNKIKIGFLTAGYLYWFGTFGYSWVFQKHLDDVRKQILNPDKEILPSKYFAHSKELNYKPELRYKPWIGVIPLGHILVPAMGFEQFIVFYPPADNHQLYQKLNNAAYNCSLSELRIINFALSPPYGPPVGVICEDNVLVLPETKRLSEGVFLYFSKEHEEGTILKAVTDEEADKMPNTIRKEYDLRSSRTEI